MDAAVRELQSDRYSHLSRINNVSRGHTVVPVFFPLMAHKYYIQLLCLLMTFLSTWVHNSQALFKSASYLALSLRVSKSTSPNSLKSGLTSQSSRNGTEYNGVNYALTVPTAKTSAITHSIQTHCSSYNYIS